MFNKIKCSIKGHTLIQAGTCPFTGSTYEYCERCGTMIPIQEEMLKDIDMSGEEWNDHDKDGVAYWDKYAERLRYMEENGI